MGDATSRRRRWPAVAAIAAASLAVGAIVGGAGGGAAATTSPPTNSGTPTISGTPQENSTLSVSNGTWSGSPTSYAYAWSRCDKFGNSCATISGATANSYKLTSADVGHTIRATVTASNSAGKASATSAPTAVVSSAAAPTSTAPPTITGKIAVGSTLTASTGTWSGSPTGYAYRWSRCDENGASCSTISGATGQTYVLKQVDVGTTLRVAVTATNSAGSTEATSVPTGVVPAPLAAVSNGCPSGSGTIQVGSLSSPARLTIDQESVTPSVVTPSARTIQVRFRVTACEGRPVQGALAYAAAIPFNQYSVPAEVATGADGTATLVMTQLGGFPADKHQELLAMFLRARKSGEPLTGGISTRLLASFPVSLH